MPEGANEYDIDVYIITLNWNVSDKLQNCIDSLLSNIENVSYEMLVIDNNSQDMKFNEVADKYSAEKQISFIHHRINEGGASINQYRNRIRGKYLLLLAPDTVLLGNTVYDLKKFMDNNPDAGAATAKLLNPDGSEQKYYFKFWDIKMAFFVQTIMGILLDRFAFRGIKKRHYFGEDIDLSKQTELESPAGVCFIIRYDLLKDDDDLIDPDFPFFYGDADLCRRIWGKGYKVYLEPNAAVIHDQRSSFKKADNEWKREKNLCSQIKYFKKHHPEDVWKLKAIIVSDLFIRILFLPIIEITRTGVRNDGKTPPLRKFLHLVRLIPKILVS